MQGAKLAGASRIIAVDINPGTCRFILGCEIMKTRISHRCNVMSNIHDECILESHTLQTDKFIMAERLGATDFVDSSKLDVPVQKYIAGTLTQWGVDYSFDCTGNVNVMRAALECAHRGMCSIHTQYACFYHLLTPWISNLRLGNILCYWRGGIRTRNQYSSFPTSYGTSLERNCLWRLQKSFGCPQVGGTANGG